jgi:L-malate glycosyltransferase
MGTMEKTKELKVLHIDSANEWRGGQQQVVYLIEGLIEAGVTTKLVCRPNSPLWNYCIKNNLPRHSLLIKGELDFVAAYKLSRLIKSEKFNIVHAHTAHDLSTALWAKIFYPNFKLIGARRVDFSINKSFLSVKKYNNYLVDRIICVSKNVLMNSGIPESKLSVVHDGVDLARFKNISITKSIRHELGIPENSFLIGTIAALVDHKDYPTLLRATQKVIINKKNVFFIAVGDGPLKNKLYILSEELNIDKQFKFLGFRTDVAQLLKQMDIFVLSSKEEGLGSSILDAQASAVPIVATRGGGIPELICHEKTGLLSPVKDVQILSKFILELIENSKIRNFYITNGLRSVEKFTVKKYVERTLQIYRECIGSAGLGDFEVI